MRPNLKVAHLASSGPTSPSPPQSPTATSPKFNRKAAMAINVNGNGYLPPHAKNSRHKAHQSNIHPLGGTKFSYTRAPRPEEISPRSSASSDEESEESASPPQSPVSDPPEVPQPAPQATSASTSVAEATFAIEELSDFDPDDCDDDDPDVLRPSEFEYPESDRSRSRTRQPPDMDPAVMSDFRNLNPFDDDSDDDGDGDIDDDFRRNLQQRRAERRLRRMKSGSISKRTISERGSDSDKEDILPYHDGPETGTNTRRLRRKTDRHSMQFSGQFFERIEELKEPNSDDEIILDDAEVFARELPYWTLMDVDSE
ncbi:hypothetical protein MGN70_009140 [Eutypa lata]|nr:hypothetical protein MGN70_009140 [Eutypa lata]